MTKHELELRYKKLEDTLHDVRETANTKLRDYQVQVKELEKLVYGLQKYIAALEVAVKYYAEKANEVTIWKN